MSKEKQAASHSASVGNGAGAALPKPEEAGHGIDLHEISAVAPADYGADKSGAPVTAVCVSMPSKRSAISGIIPAKRMPQS